MKSVGLLVCAALVGAVTAANGNCFDVKEAFWQSQIVPDVVESPPSCFLTVLFPIWGSLLTPGQCMMPMQVQREPTVTWRAEKDALYTLVMTDPDVPSRIDQSLADVRHWWVVNIKGGNSRNGQTVFKWLGSAPDKNTGCHRYVFLLFKQSSEIKIDTYVGTDTTTDQNLRLFTKIKDLQEEYGLELKCGNFYRAGYDKTTDKLREQIGIPTLEVPYNLGNCSCVKCLN
ncbi:PEBP1.2 family protein [Megaselia abdita]